MKMPGSFVQWSILLFCFLCSYPLYFAIVFSYIMLASTLHLSFYAENGRTSTPWEKIRIQLNIYLFGNNWNAVNMITHQQMKKVSIVAPSIRLCLRPIPSLNICHINVHLNPFYLFGSIDRQWTHVLFGIVSTKSKWDVLVRENCLHIGHLEIKHQWNTDPVKTSTICNNSRRQFPTVLWYLCSGRRDQAKSTLRFTSSPTNA